jgi:hypothetical protein
MEMLVMNNHIVLSPQQYYETHGYYLWRGLVDKQKIDALVSEYQRGEDIDERAGRFYVLPGSQTVDLHSDRKDLPHAE